MSEPRTEFSFSCRLERNHCDSSFCLLSSWTLAMHGNGSDALSDEQILEILKTPQDYKIDYEWRRHSITGRNSSALALEINHPIFPSDLWGKVLILVICVTVEQSQPGCSLITFKIQKPPNIDGILIEVSPLNGIELMTYFQISCTQKNETTQSVLWKYSLGYSRSKNLNIQPVECTWLENKRKQFHLKSDHSSIRFLQITTCRYFLRGHHR